MSTLYLGTDQVALAERLAGILDAAADPFRPATVVVPNRYLAKWLRLWLARTRGIAINLRFLYLESALWEMLRGQDPRQHAVPLGLVDADSYRLMVLSVLLDEKPAPDLGPLLQYLRRDADPGRAAWRRAWQLADRLGRLVRDYEYHRQDVLIQHWLRGELGYAAGGDARVRLEKSQREVFQQITRLPDGKRARLGQTAGKLYKTLPQYAMEIMELAPTESAAPASDKQTIHLFGITQISYLHLHTLRWLGNRNDLRLYHLNPLVAQLPSLERHPQTGKVFQELADRFRSDATSFEANELLAAWGRAAAESLWLLADLVNGPFDVEVVPGHDKESCNVLGDLQAHLLNGKAAAAKRPQDTSLQIVGCPGIYREVETVHNSILFNLQQTPDLKQTDIAVLVTDMPRYRPVLQAVFEREPRRVLYNLADFSAAGMSAYGQALLGCLDLALESFSRSRVMEVLLNPCFLARLNLDRTQTLTWLSWAEELGIYHGWDAKDKAERGYPQSPLFGWQLALRRMRLGRLMDTPERDGRAPRFRDVVPYADLATGDKEQLDAFCRSVEGLLPALLRLRKFQGSGHQWANDIVKLMQRFLAIPADRPEEGQVRNEIIAVLEKLRSFDQLAGTGATRRTLPLALVREMIADSLEAIEGAKGEYLTGGVTISALQPFRPVPFRIIYLLGLGEDVFPGTNRLPTFDLRSWQRCAGDIRPAEHSQNLFLEALLAAREKIYLLFPNRELQRDQELHPGMPINQLREFLEEHVIPDSFEIAAVPLTGCDARYLQESATAKHDVAVNYSDSDRLLALEMSRKSGEIALGTRVEAEVQRRWNETVADFTVPAAPVDGAATQRVPTVSLRELQRFLVNPAEASLRRHLGLTDSEDGELEDDEPFVTGMLKGIQLRRCALEGFVQQAVSGKVRDAVKDFPAKFAGLYDDWRLQSRTPEGAFADIDQAALARDLQDRLAGQGGLTLFLTRRKAMPFVGPVLLGEARTPVNAQQHFPALTLKLAPTRELFGTAEARLVGSWPLAWRSDKALEMLAFSWGRARISGEDLCKPLLEPLLVFLALQAGDVAGPDGVSSRAWLDGRGLVIHVAHDRGIATFRYAARTLTPERARKYLVDLSADFLDAGSYDQLPFDLIVRSPNLKEAYLLRAHEARKIKDSYRTRFREILDQDQENDYSDSRSPDLFDLVEPEVPADACAKVWRRLRLLDRGPALNRLRAERNQGGAAAGGSRPARRP
jgi:exodeoxyribonuclease V gamma subunit